MYKDYWKEALSGNLPLSEKEQINCFFFQIIRTQKEQLRTLNDSNHLSLENFLKLISWKDLSFDEKYISLV